MIDALFVTNLMNTKYVKTTTSDEESDEMPTIAVAIIVLLYLILIFWSITRALKCSQSTPDSRAIHILFCFMSPMLYLFSSYLVPGFCPV
jgi:hypothetical protein